MVIKIVHSLETPLSSPPHNIDHSHILEKGDSNDLIAVAGGAESDFCGTLPPTPHTTSNNRRGRTSDFTAAQIDVLLCKVLPVKAQIAPHGTENESFEIVAEILNGNDEFSVHIDGKSAHNRYECLQCSCCALFNQSNRADTENYGLGGEVTAEVTLLSEMREGREEVVTQREREWPNIGELEARKSRAVESLIASATRGERVMAMEDDEGAREGEENGRHIKRKRILSHGERFGGEVEQFSATLKQSDGVQEQMDLDCLAFVGFQHEEEMLISAEDHEARYIQLEEARKERAKRTP